MSERATKNDKLSNREHFLKCCDEGEIFEDKSTWKIVSKPKAVSEHWNHFKISVMKDIKNMLYVRFVMILLRYLEVQEILVLTSKISIPKI